MNAAFLLMTSALLAGQAAEKKAAPATATPAPAVASACGSGGCDPCGCEGFGHRLRDRLRGLFKRDNCDTCQPATCAPAHHSHVSLFNRGCNDCGPRVWNWQPACKPQTCAPTCNDPCAKGGLNILAKLRAKFHRNDACCDGGCSSPVTAAPPATSQPLPNPGKKMPSTTPTTPAPKAKPQEVRIDTPPAPTAPIAPSVIPVVPNGPAAVEITPLPVPAPRIETNGRDPF